ncbi:MAG TPA: NADH:ubiquinone oxidoreductase subunit N, partial [Burkholderiales bacterium]|nr:NADH:ubiquinone oxidoreductase subunit N [Burkholderiales bacterium]
MNQFDLPILLPAYPEMWLLAMASIVLVVDLFLPGDSRRAAVYWLSLATLAGCALLTIAAAQATGGQPAHTFGDMFVADLMAHTLKLVSYVAVAGCFVYSRRYLADRDMLRGEYFVLALFAL